jgi:type 1 fimbria pilin
MSRSSFLLWVGVALAGMLCIPRAAAASGSIDAAGGRITFSGAIVVPTCIVKTEGVETLVANASGQNRLNRMNCAGPEANAAEPQVFTVTVVRVSSSTPDRVLNYFDTYVKANRPDAADPLLLTQTYE